MNAPAAAHEFVGAELALSGDQLGPGQTPGFNQHRTTAGAAVPAAAGWGGRSPS